MYKKELVAWLKDHDLMEPGHRNDDMVNLCILATMEYGAPDSDEELVRNIDNVVRDYNLSYSDDMGYDDFRSNMLRVLPYLKTWEHYGLECYTIN